MTVARLIALALVVAALVSAAQAQDDKPDEATVRRLMEDPTALKAALAHCDPNSLTSDRDCQSAQEAEDRNFFSEKPSYTPQKVDVFPHTPDLRPSPKSAPATPLESGAKQP